MSYVRKPSLQSKAPPAISQPSAVLTAPPERWQHGQARTGHDDLRQAERVVDGVRRLREAGDIGDAEVIAADRWYRDYVAGVEGARDPERRSSGAAPDPHMTMLVRVRALEAHRAVKELIGEGWAGRLQAFLVDELSFSAMAARFDPGRDRASGSKRMAAQLAAMLQVLANTYAYLDRKRSGHVGKETA